MQTDKMEVFYWSLFALLFVSEILVVFVFKLDKKHMVRDWVEPAFEAMIIATIIRTLFLQSFNIPTGSMENTLLIGDHPMANKFIYGTYNPISKKLIWKFSHPKRGEVVIFRNPDPENNNMLIKRCIGLPGDIIEMKNKQLYVNGEKIIEDYVTHRDYRTLPGIFSPRDNFYSVKVPENHIFVMGDNRDNSHDSRFFGPLPYDQLRGKAILTYWPLNRIKRIRQRTDVFSALTNKQY